VDLPLLDVPRQPLDFQPGKAQELPLTRVCANCSHPERHGASRFAWRPLNPESLEHRRQYSTPRYNWRHESDQRRLSRGERSFLGFPG